MKLIILIGISCSGKSTYCKSLNIKDNIIISKDLEREKYFKTNINSYFNNFNLKETEPIFNKYFNNLILKTVRKEINSNKNIVIDSRGTMSFINFILNNFYGIVSFKYFDIDINEAKKRATLRIQKSGDLDRQNTAYNNVKNYLTTTLKSAPTFTDLKYLDLREKLIVITDVSTLKRLSLKSSDITIITTKKLHNYLEKQYPQFKIISFNKSEENKYSFMKSTIEWIVENKIGKERYADDINLSNHFQII